MILWGCANDPELAETRLTIFFKVWVYVFEAVWDIYGSTFIYSDKVSYCDDTLRDALEADENDIKKANEGWDEELIDNVETLRISAIVLLVLGYLIWIWILCSLCVACAYYRMLKKWH